MKFVKSLLTAAALVAAIPGTAQVSASPDRFSPLAYGYIERARSMRDAGNFQGVVDQLRHLDTQMVSLSPEMSEEYTFLLADAYYMLDDAECLRLLIDFRNNYPASPLALRAALAVGDFYFYRNEWADALEAYSLVDIDRLNRDDRMLYSYRKGLALIKTGHYAEAKPFIEELEGDPEFEDAYNFYTAYLDYIDGRFDDAYDGFRKVTPSVPGLEAGYYMTQIEYSRGEYEDVVNHGSSLLRKNPVEELCPEIYRIVGLSYFKLGEPDVARSFLTNYFETTKSAPEPDAVYAMGALDYADGDYDAAIECFSAITDQQDAVGQGAWLYLGQCYMRQDNPSSAALAFEKASKMNFDHAVSETALYDYVTALTRGGKVPFSSSSEMLENFVRRYPDSEFTPQIESYLATAYYNDRNFTKALECIDAVRNPTSDMLATRQKILYELGIESVTNGNTDEAVDYLRQAVALRSHDRNLAAQASLWLGDALFSLHRFKEARQCYEAFIKDDVSRTNRALGFYDLAYAKYKLEDYKGAAVDFASALKASPALPEQLVDDARIRRADCLYYTGRYAEAASLFSQAISDGANDADYALYRRAILHGLSGDTKAKIADLKRAETDYPSSRWMSKILLELALAYEETGQSSLAADAYKKRLGVADDVSIDELLRMATAMNDARRWDDLLDVVERIRHAGGLEADELAEISLYEADALANTGREDEAVDVYSQLAENPTSLPGSKAAVSLAEIDLKHKRYEDARVRMEEFTDVGTPHQYWLARGFIALADAYYGLGQKSLAREYISSLQENYPGSESDIKSMINSRLKKWK